jgi:hypothetical protein
VAPGAGGRRSRDDRHAGAEIAFVFHWPWKTNLHTFFTHFDHGVLIVLLGLLEAAPGTRAEGQALRLLEMMRLPPDEPDAR